MDLESSLDRMCMGVEELNFRMARIEIAIRRQNVRIRMSDPVIVIKDVSSIKIEPEVPGRICP
jgi:translation initiation factor IF-1